MIALRRIVFMACLLLLSNGTTPAVEPASRRNVIVILSDDQGWGDLSLHGNSNLRTPNIDSIAARGAQFDRFFVQPVCSPTRAEFLTGRYHPRGGVFDVSTGGERLNLDEKTIADLFKTAGYATGCFGKWHNGTQYPYHPLARGFQEYYGFTSGHWGDYFSPPLDHNGKRVRGKGYLTDDLTDHALQFIESHKNKPFFCYVPYNTPHSPMQVPDRWFEPFRNASLSMRYDGPQKEDLEFTRAALAMCENIDGNVGRILKKLDDLKLTSNTIVVYFCDNGPNSWRWNGGMRGRKGSTDEGGTRSPLLVQSPGQIAAGTRVDRIAGAIDLLPTLCELAGVSASGTKPLDGKSLAPLLRGQSVNWPDRTLYAHWANKVSARSQRYRLDDTGRLYDLQEDPGQKRDRSGELAAVHESLEKEVKHYREQVLSSLKREVKPFSLGYREFPLTELPARDGRAVGGVQRSARAPNDSFFTNWTKKEDQITWDVDVHTAGKYQVELEYTCARDAVGSIIELRAGDHNVQAQLSEAHDPPLRGQEHDRVSRAGESYVKDFKWLPVGEIELTAGRQLLRLRAVKIAGKQVADVRGITLKLLSK